MSSRCGALHSCVKARVKRSLNRVGDNHAKQGASRTVVVLRDLDLDLAEVVLASIRVGQRGTRIEADLRCIVDVETFRKKICNRKRCGRTALSSCANRAVDTERCCLSNDNWVRPDGLGHSHTRELVAHAHPGAQIVTGSKDCTGVLIRQSAGRTVLEADVVRRSHIVVVLLGRSDRVVVAGEIRGLFLGKGRGDRALEPNAGAGLGRNIAIDGETGDPFTIGKGDVRCLGVVGDNVVTLVGPVFESPAALIFVARLAEDAEAVRAHHGRLITVATCSLCVLSGPCARQGVIEVNVCRRITGVDSTEAPWSEALANLVLVVVTGLNHATTRLTNGETVGDFRALGHDGCRVILNRSCDSGLICDRVGRRYRTFGVLHGNEGLDGVLPCPLVIGPSNSVGCCIVNAAVGSGDEYCLCRKRIDDLNVLDLHEAGGVDAILQ